MRLSNLIQELECLKLPYRDVEVYFTVKDAQTDDGKIVEFKARDAKLFTFRDGNIEIEICPCH
jgi:cobalamin biosynthesis protein CbiG